MITLNDIAKRCKISVSQVSRALNDSSNVSKATKDIVIKAAQEMGYVKNIFASHLVNQSSNQIAVFIEGVESDVKDLTNNNVFCLLKGIHEFCSQHNFEPSIYINNKYSNIEYIDFCKQRLISGLIIFGCNYDDENFLKLIDSGFPMVSVDIVNEQKRQGCVIVNNAHYAKEAVLSLANAGCKNIALIKGNEHSHVSIERLTGYQMALQTLKMPLREEYIVCANFDMNTAREQTVALLKRHPEIDGVFSMSDQMAIGCYEAVKQLELDIPKDIKIFGFDGDSICKFVSPKLSTVEQHFTTKGYAAAKLLTAILSGKSSARTIAVPCDVVVRESSR